MAKLKIVLLALLIIAVSQVTYAKPIGPLYVYLVDQNGQERSTYYPGDSVDLVVAPRLPVDVEVTVEVFDPNGVKTTPLSGEVIQGSDVRRYRIFVVEPASPEGYYTVRVTVVDRQTKKPAQDQLHFEVRKSAPLLPAPQPSPQLPGSQPDWTTIAIAGAVAAVAIAAIAMFAMRNRGARGGVTVVGAPPMPVPPSPAPLRTEVKQATAVGTALAYLQLPNGQLIPITSPVQEFGRDQLSPYIPADQAKYISARHFRIMLQGNKWYVEDLGSTNGTIVDGQQIKGRGPVEIQKGSVISPAGVVMLKFLPAGTEVYKSS